MVVVIVFIIFTIITSSREYVVQKCKIKFLDFTVLFLTAENFENNL